MNKYLNLGKYTKECPRSLIQKVIKVKRTKNQRKYVRDVLGIIRDEFNPNLHRIITTNDFEKSRFISVSDVLRKRQRSCGSMTTVAAAIMRKLGIPTKLINGLYIPENPRMRHAWIEVSINKKWVPFDIMRKDFKIGKYHIKKDEWLDWGDLEKVWRKENNK